MIFNMCGGAGFSGSTVLSAVSVSALPGSNMLAGTLAIISATDVGEVFVRSTQPYSGIQAGDVWLVVGSGGLSYAADEQLLVSLSQAYQHNGAGWQPVSLYMWTGAQWIAARTYLLNGADECTALTGGWQPSYVQNATCTKISTGFSMTEEESGAQTASITSKSRVTVSGMSTLVCQGYTTGPSYGGVTLALTDNASFSNNGSITQRNFNNTGNFELRLDISTCNTTSRYVGLCCATDAVITAIWLEP